MYKESYAENSVFGGIIIDKLRHNQLCLHMVKCLNKIHQCKKNTNVTLYINSYGDYLGRNRFPILNNKYAWNTNHPIVCTCIDDSYKLINFLTPSKLFYVWDLEWQQIVDDVDRLGYIYCNSKISLIARSESHARIIEYCWKRPEYIMEDWNYEQLINILCVEYRRSVQTTSSVV